MICGHMPFGIHEFVPRSSAYTTILRDPIDRVISEYFYVLRTPEHPFHKTLELENISLKNYVSRKMSSTYNCQTWRLAGFDLYKPLPADESVMLEKAKRNINNYFSMVGVTERFDEYVLLLQRRFGWSNPFYVRENVGFNRISKEDIDKSTLSIIEENNALDIELYDMVKASFNKTVTDEGRFFKLRTFIFKSRNRS